MIYVIAAIELAEGKKEDYLKKVRELVPKVRAEKGCLEYGPAVDANAGIKVQQLQPNVVTMIEKWEDIAALQAHLGTPHMLEYRQAVKGMVVGTQLKILQPA